MPIGRCGVNLSVKRGDSSKELCLEPKNPREARLGLVDYDGSAVRTGCGNADPSQPLRAKVLGFTANCNDLTIKLEPVDSSNRLF